MSSYLYDHHRAGGPPLGDPLHVYSRLSDDDEDALLEESAIRFAHVRSLVPIDARNARVTLTSGEEFTLRSGSSDIGRSMRGVEIEVPGIGLLRNGVVDDPTAG